MTAATVGIVLVSHSAELAAGAAHLAAQVSGGTVTIIAAGGTDDGEDHGDAESVLLADAPFVEGAVAATVTAAAGGDIKAVVAAAEEARHVRKL
jgi:PTS hybrid protein